MDIIAAEQERGKRCADGCIVHARIRFAHFLKRAQCVVQAGHVLFIVAGPHLSAEIEGACIRPLLAHQNAKERRFSTAVRPEQEQAFPPAHMQGHIAEHRRLICFGKPFCDEHIVPAHLVRMKAEANAFRFPLRRNERRAQTVRLLLLGGRGNEVAFLPPAALLLYNAFDAADFLLRVQVFAAEHLLLVRHQFHMARVISFGKKKARVLDLHGAVCHRIKEIPVMRNDDKRARVAPQIFFQPGDGVNVKMIRWLIQKKQVRSGEQHPRKLRLVAFSSAHVGKRLLQFRLREAEPEERRARAAAEGQPSAVLIALAQGMLAAHKRIQFFFRRVLQGRIYFLHRCLKLHERGKHRKRRLIYACVRVFDALRHGDYARAAVFVNSSLIRLFLPQQDAEQRRFSTAVHADEANLVLFVDFKANVFKEQPLYE